MRLFGYEIIKPNENSKNYKVETDQEEQDVGYTKVEPSIVPPNNEDGAYSVDAFGSYAYTMDVEGGIRDEQDLIRKYRNASNHPEVDSAIDDIVNEAIVNDEDSAPVEIILDDLEMSDSIKKKISEEFENVVKLLNFHNEGSEIFRRWYIDGRLNYHVIIDQKKPQEGIKELRYMSPLEVRKIRENIKETQNGVEKIVGFRDYYRYVPKRSVSGYRQYNYFSGISYDLTEDSVVHVHSGRFDEDKNFVTGYLHKALKPINMLRMEEDALVIYRLARAPERRVFNVAVGDMPKSKAENYIKGLINKYKNKLRYNSSTGEIDDQKHVMTMMEDFWFPRSEDGKGTTVETLQGGQNLGEIEDLNYFKNLVYQSLNVPLGRLQPESTGFSLGRASEISREELKFAKFVGKLRKRFSQIFLKLLKKQLILKKIISESDWELIKENVSFNFLRDSFFAELKYNEILRERVTLAREFDDYVGVYYSREWVKKNVLQQTDEEIKEMKKEIDQERKDDEIPDENNPSVPTPERDEQQPEGGAPPEQQGQQQEPSQNDQEKDEKEDSNTKEEDDDKK